MGKEKGSQMEIGGRFFQASGPQRVVPGPASPGPPPQISRVRNSQGVASNLCFTNLPGSSDAENDCSH